MDNGYPIDVTFVPNNNDPTKLDFGLFFEYAQIPVFASVSEAIQTEAQLEVRSGLLHFVRNDDSFCDVFKKGQSPD